MQDVVVQNYYSYGTFVPGFTMTNSGLSPLAKLVYARLYALCERDGSASATILELAKQVGAHHSPVINAVIELGEGKYIKIIEFNEESGNMKCIFCKHESMTQAA